MTIRLVIADDHPLILEGLERVLSAREDYSIEAVCSTGPECLATALRLEPDILLANLHMPGMTGADIARELKNERSSSRVVILTGSLDEREALECLRQGVAGILLKEMSIDLVLHCLDKVAAGDVWLEKRSFSQALEHLLRKEAGTQRVAGMLSDRELQLVRLCAQGMSNKEIASTLSLAEGTVKAHLHNAYKKLGVEGRPSLICLAHENELV